MKHAPEQFRTARSADRFMNHATTGNSPNGGLVQHWLFLLLALMSLMFACNAMAGRINGGIAGGIVPMPQQVPPSNIPPQFDITGFIQAATLAPVGSLCPSVTDPRLMGGTVTVNNQLIIVPCNTILQMPAFATTWADLWALAPADITPAGTIGMSLTDAFVPGTAGLLNSVIGYNSPLPSHEIHIQGNIIGGQYIAGLIFISQQSLNGGQGAISCIDYATGELQIGGTLMPHGAFCPTPAQLAASGQQVTRVRMNDPIGRFGIVHGGPGSVGADVIEPGYDPRYTADTDNPTMHSALGFPVCIPSLNPLNAITSPTTGAVIAAGIDAKCPLYNRPIAPNCKSFDPLTSLPPFGGQAAGYCTTWVMDAPGAHTALKLDATDPTLAAPLVIGDTVLFNGTLKADANGPYISAHTIQANLGIYTQPHTKPAYVFVEGVLVGTGGGVVGGLAVESTTKVNWTGFTTDPTELVDFFAVHQDPITGASTEYYLQTYDPCCTPLGRFRSPINNVGAFGEPQRNYRAVSRTACQVDGVNGPTTPALTTICSMDPLFAPDATAKRGSYPLSPDGRQGNGLVPHTYTLPNFDFIFAENLNFGTPLVPNNFQDLPFLYCGSGPLNGPGTASTVVGQLDPPPWAVPMGEPIFASVLCPNATTVANAAGIVIVAPPAPLPAVINSVTATPPSTIVGRLTTVTLTISATNPNTPATAMSYAWGAPPGVVMSCGACAPNANNATVTATFTPTASGTLLFTGTAFNGVVPAAARNVSVIVAAGTAKAPIVNTQGFTPTGTINGGNVVTLSATGNTNPTGGTVTVSFRQTGGAALTLNPVTMTGTPPANQTGKATFTVPFGPAAQYTFVAIVTDTVSGLTATSGTMTIKTAATPADTVNITAVAYLDLGNVGGVVAQRGKLTITAVSTASPAPAGMTMTATFFNNTLPANMPGSSALPMTAPLVLLPADPIGAVLVICGPTPCWTTGTPIAGVIADTRVTPAVLVPPTSVTVKSSLGGSATATGAAIVIR